MSSSGAVDGTSVSHYLHPDFLEPLPSSVDPKQNPLVLLAQTCNNIGKDVSYAGHSKKGGSAKSEARMTTPPKLVSLRTDDQDKQPSSTSVEQRHSPTSTRSPKYAVTPEQAKAALDHKVLSPALRAPTSPHKSAAAVSNEEKLSRRGSTPHGGLSSPLASAVREKTSPSGAGGDSKSPSSSQETSGHASAVGSTSFPFPLPHPALLTAAYSTMPWPTLPFPHLGNLPGLACPCGQCGLGSPGASGPGSAGAPPPVPPPSSACTAPGSAHCSCAHCLAHPAAMHDSFSSACFYSGLLNSYLSHHNGGSNGTNGAKAAAAAVAAAAAAAASAASPGAATAVSAASSCPTPTSSCTGQTPSRTVEYCMYCGKHCPSPEQLLAHLQCHMSSNDSVSPPVSAPPAPAPAPGPLNLYSSSAADLLRKLYASSASAAAGISPRFHPYRSFLPKLSPHRAPFQPFGTPLV